MPSAPSKKHPGNSAYCAGIENRRLISSLLSLAFRSQGHSSLHDLHPRVTSAHFLDSTFAVLGVIHESFISRGSAIAALIELCVRSNKIGRASCRERV